MTINNFLSKTTLLVGALLLALPLAVWAAKPSPPGQHLNISGVAVNFSTDTITITGEDLGFGPGPLVVTLGGFIPPAQLNIVSADATTIVVDCPAPGCPVAGDFLLTVSNGNGQSQNDEYDLTFGAVGPEGPPGPPGPNGLSGYQIAASQFFYSLTIGQEASFVQGCPSTKRVIGGGYLHTASQTFYFDEVIVKASYPPAADRWGVKLINSNTDGSSRGGSISVYAICVDN